jgi:hypothetical protein
MMKRSIVMVVVVTVAVTAPFGAARASPIAGRSVAANLCVGGPGCFATIQGAVAAAQNGDTIRIGVGSFAGGVTIDKSVSLMGVSAAATRIVGGGPVVTIGKWLAPDPPTVSITGVTITGGLNDSQPDTLADHPGFFVAGGGVFIPVAEGGATGATVRISNSVITGNRVTAGEPVEVCSQPPVLDRVECSRASGGGIANWGTLTVTDSRVVGNVAGATATSGGLATDARGGGIFIANQGSVTVRHSVVSGNRSAVVAPHGRWAESGGIAVYGTLRVEDSLISHNHADAALALPGKFLGGNQGEAIGGGLRISSRNENPDAQATIIRSTISDNSVTTTNTVGDAYAPAGGISDKGRLVLVDSRVVRNTATASVPPNSDTLAVAAYGGVQVEVAAATIRTSQISHNTVTALNANGPTWAIAGGVGSAGGQVTLDRTLVIGNHGTVNGTTGLALGGGIFNGQIEDRPQLALSHSVVTANQLTATSGITPKGGGIYTADFLTDDPRPIIDTDTVIAGNHPDQCFGC